MNIETGEIEFYSTAFIEAHHEITINYNGTNDPTSLEWFNKRNIAYRE
jgi:hypothetical protein